ncbi:MAG: hypothetical protein RR514_03580 [Christensenella sp.]
MQRTLEQLYNGEIYPNEQLKVHAKGYQEARKTAFEAYEALENKLCQTMREELDAFLAKDSEASALEETQVFINGFQLGAKLMLEILEEDRT